MLLGLTFTPCIVLKAAWQHFFAPSSDLGEGREHQVES